MKTIILAAIAAVSGSVAAVASGAGVGNIIFTATSDDTIKYYDNGVITSLVSFSDPDVRLAEIFQGPEGQYYVSSGPFPVNTSNNKSAIYRVDNIFSSPSVSTLKSGYDMANPSGMAWNSATRNIVYANNPQSQYGNDTQVYRGIRSVNADTGTDVGSYQQTASSFPTLRTANDVTQNPYGSANDYYVTCLNGGNADFSGPDAAWSSIWKFAYDTGTLAGTPSLLVNLGDTSATGLANSLTFVRTSTIKVSTNEMYVVNAPVAVGATNGIYKINLDSFGNFAGISLLFQDNVNAPRPDAIEYNPFTDKIVFSDETTGNVYQINPDGSGFETLATGVFARGFTFIPAPGALAVAGLAGLVAARRRR